MTTRTAPIRPASSASAVLDRGGESTDQVSFTAPWPDGSVLMALLPAEVDTALGHPAQLTVTITPGDRLSTDGRCVS